MVRDEARDLGAVEGQLASTKLDGQTYYYAEAPAPPSNEEEPAHLLPPFDEVLVGYRDRSAMIDRADLDKVVPGSNGIFYPIMVHAGRVVGVWRRTLKANRVELSFNPFQPLSDAQARALASRRLISALSQSPQP